MSNNTIQKQSVTSRKNFIIKEKSLSSFPSKHFSVSDIMNQKQKILKKNLTARVQEQTEIEKKNDQITRLKRKLDTALNLAMTQKKLAFNQRQQIFKDQKTKSWFQNRIQELQNIILSERGLLKKLHKQKQQALVKNQKISQQLRSKQEECKIISQRNNQLQIQNSQISKLRILMKDLQPLKQRIKVLENELRGQKTKGKQTNVQIKKYQKQNQKLLQQLRYQKPFQQQLQQKIAYLQRVYLDLSRKMEDYDRRQNQYIRQANLNKKQIKKLSEQKAQLQDKLFDTSKRLVQKTTYSQQLEATLDERNLRIVNLQNQLKGEKQKVAKLLSDIESTKQFYRLQQIQNNQLKKRNKHLLDHQAQYQRVLAHFQKVNDQINLTIVARVQEISKLHAIIEQYAKNTLKLQQKWNKFQILFQDRTDKGDNQIKQFFYLHIRQNTRLKLKIHEQKTQLQERILKFGEERDNWVRVNSVRSVQTPSNDELFGNLYHQKNEQLLLLQGSNDQLLKIKKELQNRVSELQLLLQDEKRQAIAFKLKASQVFRAKKEVDEARKTITRYQQMIEQQNQNIKDYESQLVVLREKINLLNQKNFQFDLENKNSLLKIKELEAIMIQLNADVLLQKKNKNDKNAHLINDSLDKLQNGIKSLSFYFNCSFCGEMPANPITLSPCGHTYCQKPKCKQAYTEFCHQCDTGMPVQGVFINKYMKEAMGKYKFFKIVIDEVTSNVKALLKNT